MYIYILYYYRKIVSKRVNFMAIFKCKMCGGDLDIQEGLTTCECEYCGTKQTIPALDNEKKLNLFNRANRLRLNSEFDKAASIYENIIAEFPEEAEGYWGLVLCNYGIEYVDDPATAKKIPTCHRAAFESVTKDENYELALEYADVVSQKLYRDEAREIDRIMSEILSISKNEEPYDIFICYKETDSIGGRTIDSVIAQDVYDALTDKGYRVFFSRISLEDKIGKQYEPYIFAALNSAKVMLAFGTKYEYFHAVWVKNEWSRFLKLMAKDKSKSLVPCYKDMDAYDMPDEFKALQAQDMGKVGAIQDLVRGIEKLLPDSEPADVKEAAASNNGASATVDSLLKRVYLFLEDGEWQSADEYCEKVLDINPECAEAYVGKLMVELKVKKEEALKDCETPFDNINNYKKAFRFADDKLKKKLVGYIDFIDARNGKITSSERKYNDAVELLENDFAEEVFLEGIEILEELEDFKDSNELMEKYKQEWSSRNELAKAVWSEYTSTKDKIFALEKAISPKIASLEEITKKKANLNYQLKIVKSKTEYISSLKENISSTKKEIDGLGAFSFSRKKDLEGRLENLNKQLREAQTFVRNANTNEAESIQKINEYESIIEADNAKISEMKSELNNLKIQLSDSLDKLGNRKIIAELTKEDDVLLSLCQEDRILNMIQSDAKLKEFIKTTEAFALLPGKIQDDFI